MFYLFWEAITKKYFQLKGRANRKEYISFMLSTIIVTLIMNSILFVVKNSSISFALVVIKIVIELFLFIPSITITVRRIHDFNWSGFWNIVIFLIAFMIYSDNLKNLGIILGLIFASMLLFFKGTQGTNKYGEEPK